MVHYGSTTNKSTVEGRVLPGRPDPKELKFMGARDYSPKFDIIQKNISFKINFSGKRHSEAQAVSGIDIEEAKKETGA